MAGKRNAVKKAIKKKVLKNPGLMGRAARALKGRRKEQEEMILGRAKTRKDIVTARAETRKDIVAKRAKARKELVAERVKAKKKKRRVT